MKTFNGPRFDWIIEYEILPLRAIYHAEIDDCTEEEVYYTVETEQPMWRIRKLKPKPRAEVGGGK